MLGFRDNTTNNAESVGVRKVWLTQRRKSWRF